MESKIDQEVDLDRRRLRVKCSAGVIIPNVLPYLIPALKGISQEMDYESDSSADSNVDDIESGSESDT